MRKRMIPVGVAAATFGLVSAGSALAGPPERATNPFVCPVLTISDQAAIHADGHFNYLGDGQYTFGPGKAGDPATFNGNVPNHATNLDGAGSPPGTHSAPGDTNYTAIWSGNN
jgi:hypothetical protein